MIFAALAVLLIVMFACLAALDRMAHRTDEAHRLAGAALQRALDEANNRLAAAAQGMLYLTPTPQPPTPDPHAGEELWSDDTGLVQSWFPAEGTD